MARSPGPAPSSGRRVRRAQQDPLLVRAVLIAAAVLSVGVLVIVPPCYVFVQALRPGRLRYSDNLVRDPDTWHRDHLDPHRGADRRGREHRLRRRRRLGHRPLPLPRPDAPHHADRPAVLGLAGSGGADVRADLRPAGLPRPVPAPRRLCVPCPTSWRRRARWSPSSCALVLMRRRVRRRAPPASDRPSRWGVAVFAGLAVVQHALASGRTTRASRSSSRRRGSSSRPPS